MVYYEKITRPVIIHEMRKQFFRGFFELNNRKMST